MDDRLRFVCANCGGLTPSKYDDLENGTNLICVHCDKSTVVELFTVDGYVKRHALRTENARLKELLKVPDELVELSLMSDADSKNKFTDRAISLTLGLIARQEGDSDAATKTKAML